MADDPKSYEFMKETIKRPPLDKRRLAMNFVIIALAAALFGAVAAVTFVLVEPRIVAMLPKEGPPDVDIPSDEDPGAASGSEEEPGADGTVSGSSVVSESEESTSSVSGGDAVSASGEDGGTGSPEDSVESESTESPAEAGSGEQAVSGGEGTSDTQVEGSAAVPASSEPGAAGADVPGEAAGIGLEEYKQLYKDMLAISEKPKRSLVTVIGITNQMDYFNQNYENQQQISGLIVADNGQELFILTEYRIVENVERIQVTFWDGVMVDAIYQKHDINTNLTILKVGRDKLDADTLEGLEIAPLGNSYNVEQGDPILALGSPIGYSDSVAYGVVTSVTNRISALDTEYTLLTTDILGSAEGSGILVNLDGEIVGIISQGYSSQDKNIITGLAISQIKRLIEGLSNNVSWPYLGVRGQNVTAELSSITGIPEGILVTAIAEESPAAVSGIKEADVLVKINEMEVETLRQFSDELLKHAPGEAIHVTAMRKGSEGYVEVTFDATLGER